MSNVSDNIENLFAAMTEYIQAELAGFAEYAEQLTRTESETHWQDDSGSARDSITAYVAEAGDPQKNFDAGNWSAARSPGYQSPVWGNTDENFQPYTEDVEPEGDVSVMLTMFVPYAEALETGNNDRANNEFMRGFREYPQERMPRVPGLLGDMTPKLQDNFANAVSQAFQSALG